MKILIKKFYDGIDKLIDQKCEIVSNAIYEAYLKKLNQVKTMRNQYNLNTKTANPKLVKNYLFKYTKQRIIGDNTLNYDIYEVNIDFEKLLLDATNKYDLGEISKKKFYEITSELQAISVVQGSLNEENITKKMMDFLSEINLYDNIKRAVNAFLTNEDGYLFMNLGLLSYILKKLNFNNKEKYLLMNIFFCEISRIEEILKESDEEIDLVDDYLITSEVLKDYDFNDLRDLSENDLKELFDKLSIDETLCDSVINGIKAVKSEEENNTKEEIELNIDISQEIYKNKEEEKKKLMKELPLYFDNYGTTLILKRFLNREETNRVLYIFKVLGYDKETTIKFLEDNELFLVHQSLIQKYEYLKPVLEYYKSSYGFEAEYDMLNEFYEGIMSSEDEESKELNEKYLGEMISELSHSIPKGYNYELRRFLK